MTSTRRYEAADCRVVISHAELSCRTVEGVGGAWRFVIRIGGQSSAMFQSGVGYAAPRVMMIAPMRPTTADGRTQRLTMTGANFGPPGHPLTSVEIFGEPCELIPSESSHTTLVVWLNDQTGESLPLRVSVGEQENAEG